MPQEKKYNNNLNQCIKSKLLAALGYDCTPVTGLCGGLAMSHYTLKKTGLKERQCIKSCKSYITNDLPCAISTI